MSLWCAAAHVQRNIQAAEGSLDEAADLRGSAQEFAPAPPLGGHFFRLDGVLREAGTGFLPAFLGVAPADFHLLRVVRETEVEG